MADEPVIYTSVYQAPEPFGELTLASDGESLNALCMAGQRFAPNLVGAHHDTDDAIPVLRDACLWLDSYFAGEQVSPYELLLAPSGSGFRRRVWHILAEIPWGHTITYGDIAHCLERERGRRASALAVGGAVGHNPLPIIVPCHRVVGASGSLTGYGCGMARKVWLLEHEGTDMSGLFVPKGGTAL